MLAYQSNFEIIVSMRVTLIAAASGQAMVTSWRM